MEQQTELQLLPQNCPDWDGWSSSDFNSKYFRTLFNHSKKLQIDCLGPDIYLYQLPTKYFLADIKNNHLLYVVELKNDVYKKQSTIQQIRVWADLNSTFTKNLSEKIFWQFVAPRADLIISDSHQTKAGKAFWQRRIAEAFRDGYPVYLIDMNASTQVRYIDHTSFIADVDGYYGNLPKFEAKRVAIGKP
jgi:hypothetical protein